MNVLFICNQNQNRSKTAEEIFKGRFNTKSSGLFTSNLVSEKELFWADVVVVMEDAQRIEIAKRFPEQCLLKRIVCLGIPDIFRYNQPELVGMLESKVNRLLKPLAK